MAYLQHPERDQPVYLVAHHTIGRRQGAVDTRITSAEISGIHAAIQWTGTHWNIRDLSRNGTWLNEQQLVPAKSYPLQHGDKICFGRANNPTWIVENLDAPENLLIDLQTGDAQLLEQYHLLPNDSEPLASLHFNPIAGQWQYEFTGNSAEGGNKSLLGHSDRIDCGLHSWQLFLADNLGATKELALQQMSITDFHLRFSVSSHEEHVQLQLQQEELTQPLPARIHNYLLLYLARARFKDMQNGMDLDSQGWVSIQVATHELGITVNHLNTQIFRARKQISESLPDAVDISNLVERRSWEIRLGCHQFEIHKSTQLEARTDSEEQ
ncbi:FHA domain-containing protein [uncultured Microbulbifer sp.]|uniref:FHA domain-containing protein n=1 Tax=uncultured Microbulbifer sp. TaxID=348147 RepID=UPI0026144F30|nr:FHA domain-containing protein [uncultured Microbulbifer sp.]